MKPSPVRMVALIALLFGASALAARAWSPGNPFPTRPATPNWTGSLSYQDGGGFSYVFWREKTPKGYVPFLRVSPSGNQTTEGLSVVLDQNEKYSFSLMTQGGTVIDAIDPVYHPLKAPTTFRLVQSDKKPLFDIAKPFTLDLEGASGTLQPTGDTLMEIPAAISPSVSGHTNGAVYNRASGILAIPVVLSGTSKYALTLRDRRNDKALSKGTTFDVVDARMLK